MGIQAPFTMIASDGMPYAPGAHPRSAGTFRGCSDVTSANRICSVS